MSAQNEHSGFSRESMLRIIFHRAHALASSDVWQGLGCAPEMLCVDGGAGAALAVRACMPKGQESRWDVG